MKSLAAGLACVLTLTVVAGCLSSRDDDADGAAGSRKANLQFRDDWAERAVPYEGHDHRNAAEHQGLSTPNFELMGWDPLISEYYGRSAGGYLCGDSVDNGERRLAAVHGIGTDVAFELVDVTDPRAPVLLGEFIMPRASSRDVALTPDGQHVAVAISDPDTSQKGPLPVLDTIAGADPREALFYATGTPFWRSACNDGPVPVADLQRGPEQEVPYPPGVMLVGIADPTTPTIESYYPLPVLGAHSVYAGELDGRTIVIASVVNLAAAVSNFWFFEVNELGLQLLSLFQDRADGGGLALINGHNDGVLQNHPVTGQPLAYLANWHQGMIILDMTDPRNPTVIGRWSDNAGLLPDPNSPLVQDGSGDVHEAIPLDTTWNGRHYTFIGQEILDRPSKTASGLVHIVDTTDPTAPFEVATWTLPVDVVWDEGAVFSTHYVSFYNTTLFVSHYHAGVWAIDLSGFLEGFDEADTYPPAVGVFIPANLSPKPPPPASYDWTPTIMDANVLPNGDLVIWDSTSGVYVVRYDDSQPAPPRVWDFS